MTARSTYEASVKTAATTKVATDLATEVTRQTTIDGSATVVGYNLQTGNNANLVAAHVTARKAAIASGLAAEAARQIAITNARDTLRATGDVGRGDTMSTMIRQTGRIGHWNAARGYGFIQTADEHELFYHVSDYVSDDEPHVGDRVSFVEKQGRDGRPRAVSVMPAAV